MCTYYSSISIGQCSAAVKDRKVFERERIDGEILCELNDEILEKELGVTSRVHRIQILSLVKPN